MEKFHEAELLLIVDTRYSIGSTIGIHHPVGEKNKRNERQRQVGSKLLLLEHAR